MVCAKLALALAIYFKNSCSILQKQSVFVQQKGFLTKKNCIHNVCVCFKATCEDCTIVKQ